MNIRTSTTLLSAAAVLALAACAPVDSSSESAPAVDQAVGQASQALSPTRSPWQMHDGLEVTPSNPNGLVQFACSPSQHGQICEYDVATIPPALDSGWGPAPNGSTIGFSIYSRVCQAPVTCMRYGDFTYFQTLVDIPAGSQVTQFTIAFSGMDDGSRVTIFNSLYPAGLTVPGSYVYLGGSGTSDLKSYVVSGEVNRVVVTQVDDCCSGNNLQSAVVVLNGTSVQTSTCGNGIVEAGETCDDGNTVTGDGCSATCKTEQCIDIQRGTNGVTADAIVSPDKPTRNWGTSNSLATGVTSGVNRSSLLQFDLSAIPQSSHIMSATAKLTAYTGGGQTVRAHRVLVPWNEATVTWNDIGAAGYSATVGATVPPAVGVTPLPTGFTPQPTTSDFTALVQAWVNGTPNYGVLLEEDVTGQTSFCSSEWAYDNSYRPALHVCYY